MFKSFRKMTAEEHLAKAEHYQRMANMALRRKVRNELRQKAEMHLAAAQTKTLKEAIS